jgi:hypothetical protein
VDEGSGHCRLDEQRGLRRKHPAARVLARVRRRAAAELWRPAGKRPPVDIRRSLASSAGVVFFGC